MLVLIGIGLAAGFITAISPCVLPVLPIVFAGGATGGRRKPFAIIAGPRPQLLGLHAVRRLAPAAHWGLPEDLLRDIAIALLFLVAATLLFPKVEEIVQRPLLRLTRTAGRRPRRRLSCSARASGSSSCRARARCWRRSRSSARPRTSASARSSSRSPTRSAPRSRCSSSPSAAALGDERAPAARASHPPGARRRRRADGARDRLQRRPPLPDRDPRLHGGAPGQGRGERRARSSELQKLRGNTRQVAATTDASGLRRGAGARLGSRTGSTASR